MLSFPLWRLMRRTTNGNLLGLDLGIGLARTLPLTVAEQCRPKPPVSELTAS